MKNTILLFVIASLIIVTGSCSKSDNAGTPPEIVNPPNNSNPTLIVNLNQSQIMADGFDETAITVKDSNNVDITSSSTIIVNNTAIVGNKFYTATPGSYQVRANKGTETSSTVILKATNPGSSTFTQKVLAESFSGTWCGVCPGTIIPLENYTNTHPNVISVGVHGPSGSNDPFQYIFDPQLRIAYNVTGVPTVLLNRDSKWTGNSTTALDELSQKRAALGIAFETNNTGNIINVKVKVKFDVSTSIPLKIVLMLAEDNLKYNQANYGHFGLPNPITSFNHRNVLRSAATDIFGDAIPVVQQIKGNTWEKDYVFNAAGYVQANCKIIAFVLYDTNASNRKGLLNVQIVSAGQNKNFD